MYRPRNRKDKYVASAIDGKVSANDITEAIQAGIENDSNDLIDFYHWCRKRNRDYFHGMSMTEFRKWNEARIAELDKQPPIETTEQALARVQRGMSGMASVWCPIRKRLVYSSED